MSPIFKVNISYKYSKFMAAEKFKQRKAVSINLKMYRSIS